MAARADEETGESGSLDERDCAKRRAAKVVWARAGKMGRVCKTLSRGAREEERLAEGSEATGTRARYGDTAVRAERRETQPGSADCRGPQRQKVNGEKTRQTISG